jgi:hypothetical protein
MSGDFPMTRVNRRQINELLAAHDWRHLTPLLRAIRDFKIGLVMILAGGDRIDLAGALKRPTVIIIGDDADFAFGPAGFDPDMIETAFNAAELVVMIPGEPKPAPYRRAADFTARRRRHSVIVETLPEYEAEWLALAARYTVSAGTA